MASIGSASAIISSIIGREGQWKVLIIEVVLCSQEDQKELIWRLAAMSPMSLQKANDVWSSLVKLPWDMGQQDHVEIGDRLAQWYWSN